MTYPENLRYTKEHEWVRAEGDIGTIGITDHAQKELGDIVYVDLPKVGSRVEQGKSLGSVESVKAVSDIYSPVSGEVTETNALLAEAAAGVGAGHLRIRNRAVLSRPCGGKRQRVRIVLGRGHLQSFPPGSGGY